MADSLLKRANDCIQNIDGQIRHVQFLTGNALKIIAVLTIFVSYWQKDFNILETRNDISG